MVHKHTKRAQFLIERANEIGYALVIRKHSSLPSVFISALFIGAVFLAGGRNTTSRSHARPSTRKLPQS